MALQHINTQVTTSAGLVVKVPVGVQQTAVQIYNNTGAAIHLGDKSITSTGATIGNALANGASVQIWLGAGDELYAICATSPSGYVSAIFSG